MRCRGRGRVHRADQREALPVLHPRRGGRGPARPGGAGDAAATAAQEVEDLPLQTGTHCGVLRNGEYPAGKVTNMSYRVHAIPFMPRPILLPLHVLLW